MKTIILIISLIAAVLFASINNRSNSGKISTQPQVSGMQNIPNDLSQSGNLNTWDMSDMNNTPDKSYYSYVSGNSDRGENMNLIDASIRNEDSNYSDETVNTDDTITFQTIQNSLSSDGQFVTVNNDQIDPENVSAGDDGTMDEDIYTDRIWVPNSNYVSEGWNPYTNGRWVWEVYGWTWVSNYRWGMTYHYGRWWWSPIYGWVWSPGRRWAPAWVYWSYDRDYCGWYPLSPRIHHRHWDFTEENHHFKENHWVFVKRQDITKPVTVSTVMPYKKNKDILVNSTNTIALKENGKKLVNPGPEVKPIDKVVSKKIEQKPIDKVLTTGKKNEGIKNVQVTKTDTKIKAVDVTKKTQVSNKTVDNMKTKEITPKIDTKNKGIVNTTGIVNNKKINNGSVTTKSNVNNNKTVDNNKQMIKNGNSNKTVIKTVKIDDSGNKISNTNKTEVKTGNTNNTGIKPVNANNTRPVITNNAYNSGVKNSNANNTGIKNSKTNYQEVKIGSYNNTGNKNSNTNNTSVKTENTVTKVNPVTKISPAPKENPSQKNSNNKKGN